VHEGRSYWQVLLVFVTGVIAVAGVAFLTPYASRTHRQFESIELRGAREQQGIPSFKDRST